MVTQELILGRQAQLIHDIEQVAALVLPPADVLADLEESDPNVRDSYLTDRQAMELISNLVSSYKRTASHGAQAKVVTPE